MNHLQKGNDPQSYFQCLLVLVNNLTWVYLQFILDLFIITITDRFFMQNIGVNAK